MKRNSYQSPSDQTIKAIDKCRDEFAKTRGVTRNAVDQLFAGSTKDDYPPFREQFRDVCLTKGAVPEAYLEDLQGIYQQTRGGSSLSFGEAFFDKMVTAHEVIEKCTQALEDGELSYRECIDLIPLLSKAESAVTRLKETVIDKRNELHTMPVRSFAEKVVGRRG